MKAKKIDDVSVKAGRLIKVENQNAHRSANQVYIAVWVEDANGENERCILLTEKELERAEKRAKNNLEDLLKKSFLTNLSD